MNNWHTREADDVLDYLNTDRDKGLTSSEARKRLGQVGYNQLQESKKTSPWKLLLQQFQDFMVLVLIAATVISLFLGEYADGIVILTIVIVNAILGFVQEFKAEKSMDALKEMIAPETLVVRDGSEKKMLAKELVPGDIVVLATGDIVPADIRMVETTQFEVEESALTGESLPVKKDAQATYSQDMSLGDRKNMAYMGTVITRGQGIGVVVNTAMGTEMGKIAGLIQKSTNESTPLQRRLDQLGKWLVVFCLIIVTVVVVTGILRGENAYQMFFVGVSLAVAAIPEGLAAIVTIALAIGVQKMLKRKAIIRKLPAVETLGCATVICSDKTGTLTQNAMTVRRVYADGELLDVTGDGYEPEGEIGSKKRGKGQENLPLELLLRTSALCNNAKLVTKSNNKGGLRQKSKGISQIIGDPTEGALAVLAAKGGLQKEEFEKKFPRVYEVPFDSTRKKMSVVYRGFDKLQVYTKGAPDYVLEKCSHVYWQGTVQPMTPLIKEEILRQNNGLAEDALRVLGMAYRELPLSFDCEHEEEKIEENLIFLGLAGMIDPPRKQVLPAVEKCRLAGIKVVMITGDHRVTAQSIAQQLEIYRAGDLVLTGAQLDELSDKDLAKVVDDVTVYARVSPDHKLRIVQALKRKGHIVAMTGDGVNDAPAVKEADIGIAMGIAGTDVTKESSSMILGDDNFATIVAAIEEGRGIYDNIRKFIRYLLACNVGEVLTMFFASLLGLPIPLLAIQILWVNLVTDGLPAMALGVDPADPDVMYRRPRHPKESVFSHGLARKIAVRGVLIGLGTLCAYIIGYYMTWSLEFARTMAFTTLVFSQLFHVFDCRSERYSVFEVGLTTNRYLLGAVFCSIVMQLSVIYIPFLQDIFKTVPLDSFAWSIILVISGGITILQGVYRKVRASVRKASYSVVN